MQTFALPSRKALCHSLVGFFALTLVGSVGCQANGPTPGSTAQLGQTASLTEVQRPSDAIVLFGGQDTSAWEPASGGKTMWEVEDGAMVDNANDIQTKQQFKNYQLHLEFQEPVLGPEFKGQDRGNSGVYNQGRYEVQVLDNYHNDTYLDGSCGAVYGVKAPDKNMCTPPGQWETYDIVFRAAQYKDGQKVEDAHITVILNGRVVQDNTDIPHPTGGGAKEEDTPGPLRLQWHNHHVKYRNIWIVPIKD